MYIPDEIVENLYLRHMFDLTNQNRRHQNFLVLIGRLLLRYYPTLKKFDTCG